MKKIIFSIIIFLFSTGPVMAVILSGYEDPTFFTDPSALFFTGVALLSLAKIIRETGLRRNGSSNRFSKNQLLKTQSS